MVMARKYHQGFYRLHNPSKYVGNRDQVIFRSGWEYRAMKMFDENQDVLRWASEEVVVPYIHPIDSKTHRYFVDFFAEVRQANGNIKTFLIEVKPKVQMSPPKPQKRQTKRYIEECVTYAVNICKWDAAIAYSKKRGWEFIFMTENELAVGGL